MANRLFSSVQDRLLYRLENEAQALRADTADLYDATKALFSDVEDALVGPHHQRAEESDPRHGEMYRAWAGQQQQQQQEEDPMAHTPEGEEADVLFLDAGAAPGDEAGQAAEGDAESDGGSA
jgi:hypothetical protein